MTDTQIDLTPAQWRDRAYVLDALRTRLWDALVAARQFGVAEVRYTALAIGRKQRDAALDQEERARQVVADFVAAMHDHFAPIVPPPYPYPGSLDAFLAERHDLPMVNPWGVCGDAIDQGEGPEC